MLRFQCCRNDESSLLSVARGSPRPFRWDNETVAWPPCASSSSGPTVDRLFQESGVSRAGNLRGVGTYRGLRLHQKPLNSTVHNDVPMLPSALRPKRFASTGSVELRAPLFHSSQSEPPALPMVANCVSPVGQSRKGCAPLFLLPYRSEFRHQPTSTAYVDRP